MYVAGGDFKITPAGSLTTLHNFSYTDGGSPRAGVVLGGDGNFYGTTYRGGEAGAGTVFKLTSSGALTTLVSFNETNGADPLSGLAEGVNGDFYGTTLMGGMFGQGTTFKIATQAPPPPPPPVPTSIDQCQNGGWAAFTSPLFKNQGDCIQFVNTGR